MFVPVIVGLFYSEWFYLGCNIYLGYIIPALSAITLGLFLDRRFKDESLSLVQGLFLTGIAWILVSIFCAIPFILISKLNVVNAYFEAVSGFTTTGITMFTNLSDLPRSLIFFRSLIQWIGGLGILTFFLFIGQKGISEHIIYRGESHKIKSSRPVPNISKTIKYLWVIFTSFTIALIFLLWLEGTTFFNAITHGLTTLSTGGFSPHDASIGYYAANNFANYKLIEYTVIVFMFLGGTNFVVHYRVLRGKIESLWNNLEMKMWWGIIGLSTFLLMFESGIFTNQIEPLFRGTLFQVISIATTTGYETQFIGGEFFGAAARQIFLILMAVGGCVSSTSGGMKVRRVGIMLKGVWNRVKRASRPKEMLTPLRVDGVKVTDRGLERIFIIFVTWIIVLIAGALLTLLLSDHNVISSFSGISSALGNIGPSFLSVTEVVSLNPAIKIFYTFAMLIGRLEILPIFILLNKEVWKS
ncbi:MAG: TrkH family potassium uptake protein [Hadesarchaea archaeon]|nr:TrkH family potassium uptake protein [Hadesarchaea archaeon]